MPGFPANPNALRVIAGVTERAGAARPDPFVSALVPPFLLLQSFAQGLHQLFPGAERIDFRHFLGRQIFLGHSTEPFFRDVGLSFGPARFQAAKCLGKHLIEAVDQPLVLHIGGAGEVVEFLRATRDDVAVQRFEEGQMLLETDHDSGASQRFEKSEEHAACEA